MPIGFHNFPHNAGDQTGIKPNESVPIRLTSKSYIGPDY